MSDPITTQQLIYALIAFPVLVFSSGRLARLLTFDNFPPTAWIRSVWDRWTGPDETGEGGSAWNELAHCAFCANFYIALVLVGVSAGAIFGFGIFLTFFGWWWVVLASLAVGYIGAIIVATNWG